MTISLTDSDVAEPSPSSLLLSCIVFRIVVSIDCTCHGLNQGVEVKGNGFRCGYCPACTMTTLCDGGIPSPDCVAWPCNLLITYSTGEDFRGVWKISLWLRFGCKFPNIHFPLIHFSKLFTVKYGIYFCTQFSPASHSSSNALVVYCVSTFEFYKYCRVINRYH